MLSIKNDTLDRRECWEPFLRSNLKELPTTGDGACSIHSLVGEIDGFGMLTHPNPRGWIRNIFQAVGRFSDIATLCAGVGQQQLWMNVLSSIGNELLLPGLHVLRAAVGDEQVRRHVLFNLGNESFLQRLCGDLTNESSCFIECLLIQCPDLYNESVEQMRLTEQREHVREIAKAQVVQLATAFFTRRHELTLVKPLSEALGHTPDA